MGQTAEHSFESKNELDPFDQYFLGLLVCFLPEFDQKISFRSKKCHSQKKAMNSTETTFYLKRVLNGSNPDSANFWIKMKLFLINSDKNSSKHLKCIKQFDEVHFEVKNSFRQYLFCFKHLKTTTFRSNMRIFRSGYLSNMFRFI